MTAVTFIFNDYLRELLNKKQHSEYSLRHDFERKASIKDVIESLGIPHPIIGELTVNGQETDFDYILQHGDTVEACPLTAPVNPLIPTTLRPEALDRISFVVDVNVGKLALYLRMLGFDTVYHSELRDGKLAAIAAAEKRILLTRDTSLLKRKIVIHGYLPRAQDPAEQLIEIIRLYNLGSLVKLMSRCIPCNGRLVPVDKEAVLERLEPLTRKYYERFHICEHCGRIYWAGSHHEKIVAFTGKILKAADRDIVPGN